MLYDKTGGETSLPVVYTLIHGGTPPDVHKWHVSRRTRVLVGANPVWSIRTLSHEVTP